MNSTQYKVAIEMGFDPDRVRRVLTRQSFKCAGDLIDCLEDIVSSEEEKTDKNDDDEDDKKVAEKVENTITVQEATPPPAAAAAAAEVATTSVRKLSLREETQILYFRSVCLRCQERKRTVVCLPCCHLTLCTFCSQLAISCPLPDCRQPIKETIVTFIA